MWHLKDLLQYNCKYTEITSFNTRVLILYISTILIITFLARLLILNKKGGLLQLKFGGIGVNIYL